MGLRPKPIATNKTADAEGKSKKSMVSSGAGRFGSIGMALKYMGTSGLPGVDAQALFSQPRVREQADLVSNREDYAQMSQFNNDYSMQVFAPGEIKQETEQSFISPLKKGKLGLNSTDRRFEETRSVLVKQAEAEAEV